MYRNIVFDLGGVVVNYNPRDFLAERFFSESLENKIYDAVFGSEEWQKLDLGEISWEDAAEIFMKRGKDKDIAFEMQGVVDDWTDMLSTRRATVALMRLMKKKDFQLYYLSNIGREALALLEKRDFWPLFQGGIASCDFGFAKPDPIFYKLLLDKYGLDPKETIFTDDRKENTAAAFHAGITGIQFKTVRNFCKMLVTYGIEINM